MKRTTLRSLEAWERAIRSHGGDEEVVGEAVAVVWAFGGGGNSVAAYHDLCVEADRRRVSEEVWEVLHRALQA